MNGTTERNVVSTGVPTSIKRPGRWLAWTLGIAVLLTLTWWATRRAAPEPPLPMSLRVTFPTGIAGRVEPLLCTGKYTAADFLVVNFLSENTATLSYDSWGRGGPTSAEFTFVPGVAQTMVFDLPSLRLPAPGVKRERLQPLRVTLDGREILQAPVLYHLRRPDELYFAENTIGGNTAWLVFRGRITTDDGRVLLGSHRSLFPWRQRFEAWWRTHPWQIMGFVLASLLAGLAARPITGWLIAHRPATRPGRIFAVRPAPAHGWFVITAALCVLAFAALVTSGTFRFLFIDSFGEFYDYQAVSLLHGRLDVPDDALGGEAFVVNGKTYGYFGVTPALLRLPFAAAGVAFGQLTRSYLTLYFAACLVATYLLLCHATRVVAGGGEIKTTGQVATNTPSSCRSELARDGSRNRLQAGSYMSRAAAWSRLFGSGSARDAVPPREAVPDSVETPEPTQRSWPSAASTVLLTLATGLGSTLLFLGARAYVYHEAILCGAAFALWTVYATLRWIDAPRSRWWLGALIAGLLAVHARPSSGLFALCTLGCTALVHLAPAWRSRTIAAAVRPAGIGLLVVAAILSFNGMSYLKFGTFDGSPLRYSVQYTPERVAKFEGKNFHLSNLPHNAAIYLVRPDFHFLPRFPYFYLGLAHSDNYPGARVDLEEPTLALPYAIPALFALAMFGATWGLYWAPQLRVPMAVLGAGVIPMAIALLTAIVTSHRFTGDFCPFFIACAAGGLAVVDAEVPRLRRWLLAVTAALTLVSVPITAAVALYFQGEGVWGVPDEARQRYIEMSKRVDAFFGFGGKNGTKE
ncbi:MAG: hypothetical protein Q7S40_25640 [Opitutaceae bacterium]|nr:hypothetical protein [Opitutaceae bacterium]